MSDELHLSRRERQIMDILHAREAVTAAEIRAAMADAPSYSTVRALLRILEEKGHVKHREDGPRYVYLPRVSRGTASRSAMKRLVATFFQGSVTEAVAAAAFEELTLSGRDALLTGQQPGDWPNQFRTSRMYAA